jgi:hypothetical protein
LPDYGRTGGNPVLIAGGFPLALKQGQAQTEINKVKSVCFLFRRSWRTANVAAAHHGGNGNIPDEWVFDFQGTPCHRKTETGKGT